MWEWILRLLSRVDVLPGWKSAILAVLAAALSLVNLVLSTLDKPPLDIGDSELAQAAFVLAVIASVALKWLRGRGWLSE